MSIGIKETSAVGNLNDAVDPSIISERRSAYLITIFITINESYFFINGSTIFTAIPYDIEAINA